MFRPGWTLECWLRPLAVAPGGLGYLKGSFPTTLFLGNFKPGFNLKLAAKDVRLATDLGRELGLPMEASNLFDQQYVEALRLGMGDMDADAVATLYETRTGTKLRTVMD